MPFRTVPAAPARAAHPARLPLGPTASTLRAQNRRVSDDIVDELTRLSTDMTARRPVTSTEILAVADQIAELRTRLEFSAIVLGD